MNSFPSFFCKSCNHRIVKVGDIFEYGWIHVEDSICEKIIPPNENEMINMENDFIKNENEKLIKSAKETTEKYMNAKKNNTKKQNERYTLLMNLEMFQNMEKEHGFEFAMKFLENNFNTVTISLAKYLKVKGNN